MPELFSCPVCEHKISTEAKTCPNCGQPSPLLAYQRSLVGTRLEAVVIEVADIGVVAEFGQPKLRARLNPKGCDGLEERDPINVKVVSVEPLTVELA